MTIKLSTGEWDIHTEPFAGLTCYERIIVLDTSEGVRNKEFMDTVIHEVIHASRKDLKEKAVVTLAGDITAVLWKMGYRLRR